MSVSTKKILAMLLAFVLVLGMFPGAALAVEPAEGEQATVSGELSEESGGQQIAQEPEKDIEGGEDAPAVQAAQTPEAESNDVGDPAPEGTYTVSIYAVVPMLTVTNASGQTVSVTKADSGDYNLFTFKADAGTYTYMADGYGTGVLKISGNTEIYMRVVNYRLDAAAGCAFKMRVVNTTDEELVYTSELSPDNKLTTLLIPAYGYNVRYQFFCEPVDAKYCPFYGNLWVEQGTDEFEGFKTNGYNLSDSRVYKIGTKVKVSFKIPAGATLKVEELVRFYRQNSQFTVNFVKNEGDYDYYTADVPANSGGEVYYVVSKEGYMKVGHTFQPYVNMEITVDSLEQTPGMHEDNYEANIITNGNASKFISMKTGEAFGSWSSRAWQAINSGTANGYLEPDKHYYVVDGDSVTVDEFGIVRAVKSGLSIVAITYDAMKWDDQTYGAIREDCIGIYAFMVDGNREGVTTSLEGLSDLNTYYFAKTVTTDGVEGSTSSDYIERTITPKSENGQPLQVSVMNVSGYPTPKTTGWTNYEANADGSYTLKLYSGRNIVKVQAGDAMRCYALHAVGSNITIENVTNPGAEIHAGETVKVAYSGVLTPQPKLGAIYNPGFGNTAYLEGTLLDADGKEIATVNGNGTQYGIAQNAGIKVIPSEAGTYTISNVRIHLGAFGSAPDTHLVLSPQSVGRGYDGTDSPESAAYWCAFQDVEFTAGGSDYPAAAAAIVEQFKAIGEVEYTDACREKIEKARVAYDSASEGVKNLITEEQLKILTDAETTYDNLLYGDIEKNIEKRTIDGAEYYVITNADELMYFSKLVNGLLAGGTDARQEKVNAVLDNDITFNEAVLDGNYGVLNPNGLRKWIPIGGNTWTTGTGFSAYTTTATFRGVFDGQGHTISGLYFNNGWNHRSGLFGTAINAVIKNVNVTDSCILGNASGILGNGSNTQIENVSFNGRVDGGSQAGGIAGSLNDGIITGAVFKGKLSSTGANIGGIAGSFSGTVENCSVFGTVEGSDYVGGIAGYAGENVSFRRCAVEASVSASEGSASGLADTVMRNVSFESCYAAGDVTASNDEAAGISSSTGVTITIKNCYASGMVTGKTVHNLIPTQEDQKAQLDGPSYYLSTNTGEALDNAVPMTAEQFENGTAAYILGAAYGQKLGTDKHPVFNDGSNYVFMAGGSYVNASVSACMTIINEIGNVGLEGDENCFRRVQDAQQCYDILSEEEQAAVSNLAVLTQKQADYTAAVNALIGEIDGLGTITLESKNALDTVKAHYAAYISRGGDAAKITNLETIAAAEAAYAKCLEAEEESKIEASIRKRTVDGAEFYELSSLEQLNWFIKLVNGTLAKTPKNDAANAILTSDIVLNENLLGTILDAQGNLIEDKQDGLVQLDSIETFSGIFDGNGHVISGLFHNSKGGIDDEYALFKTLTGTVKNLIIRDAYLRAGVLSSFAGSIVQTGRIDRCGFEGKLIAGYWLGGLVNTISGENSVISNSYSMGDKVIAVPDGQNPQDQLYRIGGIACHAYGGTIKNCYVSGSLTNVYFWGGIAGAVNGSKFTIDNCYYQYEELLDFSSLNNRFAGQVIGGGSFTPEQMASGELAFKLGAAFGQNIGTDPHPVFRNDSNIVFFSEGKYTNATAGVVVALINEIGTVALDGSENCFAKVKTAKIAYEALSEAEQLNVSNADVLKQAIEAWNGVIKTLSDGIAAVTPMTLEKLSELAQMKKNIDAYTEHGGDNADVANYADFLTAQADAVRLKLEKAENSMKTREIDGETYYIITNAEQLNWFANLVNDTLTTGTEGNTAANAVLDADITVNENLLDTLGGMTPDEAVTEKLEKTDVIGASDAYTGVFDGQGHTIRGLYITGGEGTTSQIGLFGTVVGTVKNVNVADSFVGNQEANRVGGIAGTLNSTAVVEDCSYQGIVIGMQNVGGIMGYSSSKQSVARCWTDIQIATYGTASQANVGGIGGNIRGNNNSIVNCYSKGTIYCDRGLKTAQYFGGIAGNVLSAGIQNSYSVVNFVSPTKNVGGISGANYTSKHSNNYSFSNVKALGNTTAAGRDLAGKGESKTEAEFADGTVLKLLGAPYVQRIGTDPTPVFQSALPSAMITLELEKESVKTGDAVTAKIYLSGCNTANTVGYSLVYDTDILVQRSAEAADGLETSRSNVDKNTGGIMRSLYVTPGAKLTAGDDGRILLDTLTFRAVEDGQLTFSFAAIPGDVDFDGNAAYVLDGGIYLTAETQVSFAGQSGEDADAKAAAAVDALIEAIGTVTPGSGDAIEKARESYDGLTDVQKELVKKLNALQDAEARYNLWKLGDVNLDGRINAEDLSLLLSTYGTDSAQCDITLDGAVNANDLSVLLSNYGMTL